ERCRPSPRGTTADVNAPVAHVPAIGSAPSTGGAGGGSIKRTALDSIGSGFYGGLCDTARASRQAGPVVGAASGGRRCAPTALRCSVRGRAAKLASFATLSALKQTRRVRSRSALRAPTPALRFSAPPDAPPPGPAYREAHRARGAAHRFARARRLANS